MSSTRVTPCALPPRAGFTASGTGCSAAIASRTPTAPSSRNTSCESVTERGVRTPALATSADAVGLSHANRAEVGP